eukprot:CAMPEP_0184345752 /NCGR_PEP_ID=MMETSP1089-20130417/14129_1 /TAXON_ID=38269 ORGANISM="Gloeochaete wittrockiana, Strain SAG46.84" /NCGR_SAMPLE_ID=MMETSP1089 /ASSEMBLY_ACC=CAM_ASM_000445 /LENGTH=124 /DNA_ID=CAMNT_0026676181 /DNA_START=20 /DNA_END=394 /DNA_ORIENTATION=-
MLALRHALTKSSARLTVSRLVPGLVSMTSSSSSSRVPSSFGASFATSTQTSLESEINLFQPVSAMDLVNKIPPLEVTTDRISCDGGGGALGHPKVYICLEKVNEVETCGYCGLRFVNVGHGHHH